MDIELLTILGDRAQFTRFKPYVQEHVLGKEARLVFNTLDPYYKSDKTIVTINWDDFKAYFFSYRHHQITKTNAESYHTIFRKLKEHTPVTSPQTETVLHTYIVKDYIEQIRAAAVAHTKTDEDKLSDMVKLVEECEHAVKRAFDPADLFVSASLADTAAALAVPGYNWRLGELNKSLGPLRQGDFTIVAARPEVGKTTFFADQVGYMATQIRDARPVVWVNNEERSAKVNARVMQSVLGLTQADMLADLTTSEAEYTRLMNGDPKRILITDVGTDLGVDELNSVFRDHNPAIIVFDLLDKVRGFNKEERDDLRLGKLYLWARELSHKYGPVIAGSQADGSAEGVRFIQMNQLRGSKTDKAAEADAIIAIGRDISLPNPNTRFIHVPKNKLNGGPGVDPKLRHGMFEVEIEPEIARYRGSL